MLLKEIQEIYELLDRPGSVAGRVQKLFAKEGQDLEIKNIKGENGSTDFVKVKIAGKDKTKPALGVIGYLGGIGARPEQIGFTSDGDGALAALSIALRLSRMKKNGDELDGSVIVTTHLCTDAPTEPHEPVAFMGSPVDIPTMNKYLVDLRMDAILSIDTSRANKIIKTNTFAISPTVKEGWILKVNDELVRIMEYASGEHAFVLPITMQDITPYENDIYHFNSIMQPATVTSAPVVGIGITSESVIPGSATGATNFSQIDMVGRFVIEVAKDFTSGKFSFYDTKEFKKLVSLYGNMKKLQTAGKKGI